MFKVTPRYEYVPRVLLCWGSKAKCTPESLCKVWSFWQMVIYTVWWLTPCVCACSGNHKGSWRRLPLQQHRFQWVKRFGVHLCPQSKCKTEACHSVPPRVPALSMLWPGCGIPRLASSNVITPYPLVRPALHCYYTHMAASMKRPGHFRQNDSCSIFFFTCVSVRSFFSAWHNRVQFEQNMAFGRFGETERMPTLHNTIAQSAFTASRDRGKRGSYASSRLISEPTLCSAKADHS